MSSGKNFFLDKGFKAVIIIIICFSIYLFLRQYFQGIKTFLDKITHIGLLSYFITYLIIGIPIFIGTYFINKDVLKDLGLVNNILKSIGLALLFSIPMFIGGFIFFNISSEISIENLIAGTIVIGFIEELYFRGFLFGLVYKYTRLGFIPSIVFGAIIFAIGHLYQSQDLSELIGIFTVTFLGAILFAWLYVEWDYNLWIPVFLHALMNFNWHFFEMDETALGGLIPNILRGLTIMSAIFFTVFRKRRIGLRLNIRKDTLIIKTI